MQYTISKKELPGAAELVELFQQTTWANRRSIEGVTKLLQKTEVFIVIRNGKDLIGFGRALTDGVYRALLDDIIIDKKFRKQGLGGLIVKELLKELEGVEEVFLNTDDYLEAFYKKYSFKKDTGITMIQV